MAGGWIKMRSEVLRSPRLIAVTRTLQTHQDFIRWLSPVGTPNITESALRCVTGALLLRVWSDARSLGKFVGDDLIVERFSIGDVDIWAEAPGVGQAMSDVRWLIEETLDDSRKLLRFPDFRKYNAPMDAAEKQQSYRERKKQNVTKTLPSVGNGALPSEKRREEKNSSSIEGRDDDELWSKAKDLATRTRDILKVPSPKQPRDRRMVLAACYAAVESVGESWVVEAAEVTRDANPNKVWAYLRKVLANGAEARGKNLDAILASVRVPSAFLAKTNGGQQ